MLGRGLLDVAWMLRPSESKNCHARRIKKNNKHLEVVFLCSPIDNANSPDELHKTKSHLVAVDLPRPLRILCDEETNLEATSLENLLDLFKLFKILREKNG